MSTTAWRLWVYVRISHCAGLPGYALGANWRRHKRNYERPYRTLYGVLMSQRFFSNPGVDEIPSTADVVIIGGGPAGTATLWALARLAPDLQIVLIEKTGQLAAGATNASLENYRTCWPTPCLAAMMHRSIDVFHNADE